MTEHRWGRPTDDVAVVAATAEGTTPAASDADESARRQLTIVGPPVQPAVRLSRYEVIAAVKRGDRVERNPFFWSLGNADGGQGRIATVRRDVSEGRLRVCWEGAAATIVRFGLDNAFDVQLAAGGGSAVGGGSPTAKPPPTDESDEGDEEEEDSGGVLSSRKMAPLLVPENIECAYTKNEVLGKGGFAIVYRAVFVANGQRRPAAAKVLAMPRRGGGGGGDAAAPSPGDDDRNDGGSGDGPSLEQLREVEMLSKLKHDNIVHVFGYLTARGAPGQSDELTIVMELVEDGSLHSLLLAAVQRVGRKNVRPCCGGPLGFRAFFAIFQGVAQGLVFLRSRRILHRDLKPENILLSRPQPGKIIPKIADFGLSRDIHRTETWTAAGKGTYVYMAPELMQQDDSNDVADHHRRLGEDRDAAPHRPTARISGFGADVYALGLMMWECLVAVRAREFPAKASNDLQLLGRVSSGQLPPKPTTFDGHVPADRIDEESARTRLYDLIMQCLAKEPADRPSVEKVLRSLEELSVRFMDATSIDDLCPARRPSRASAAAA